MSALGIVLLIIFGVLLILLEFFVVPGVTIAGIGGLILLGASVYLGYDSFGTPTGHYILGGVVLFSILVMSIAFRSKTWRKVSLLSAINSKVLEIEESQVKPGDTGEAITRLAPMGKVMIHDNQYEAKSMGSYIDEHTEVEVVKVGHTNILVKPKQSS